MLSLLVHGRRVAAIIKFASLSSLCQVWKTLSSWAGIWAIHPLSDSYMSCIWSILIFDEHVRSFSSLNMEFKFTPRLLHCQISGAQSDGVVPQKALLPRFPFQSSGIRVHNESNGVPMRGNIFRLYRPIPSGFTAFRSISRPAARSVEGRPTSLLSTEPIDHKSGIGVRVRVRPLPLPQFVFGLGKRLDRLPESCKYDGAPFGLS